jgi:hypothetical protein
MTKGLTSTTLFSDHNDIESHVMQPVSVPLGHTGIHTTLDVTGTNGLACLIVTLATDTTTTLGVVMENNLEILDSCISVG